MTAGAGPVQDAGLRTVAEDDRQDTDRPGEEPVYEPIGPGWNAGTREAADDAGWEPQPAGPARVALSLAFSDWLRSVRTVRFWLVSAAVPLVTSLAAWILVVAVAPQAQQADQLFGAYLLAAALIPATSSFLALHWAVARVRHFPGHRGGGPISPVPGPLAAFFAVAARGPLVAALALLLLSVLAGIAGVSADMAGTAAGVVVLEFAVFGAIGAGLSEMFRRRWLAVTFGWTVAGALVVGNAVAVWALLPAVRADEPVAVTMNVVRGSGGIPEAYECAPELAGMAEVFHTERIVWMLASNPVVLLIMLADEGEGNREVMGWMHGVLQEAADGTQVPCVNGEPRTKDDPRMPLEVVGLVTQGVLAGGILAGGQVAAVRRSGSVG